MVHAMKSKTSLHTRSEQDQNAGISAAAGGFCNPTPGDRTLDSTRRDFSLSSKCNTGAVWASGS